MRAIKGTSTINKGKTRVNNDNNNDKLANIPLDRYLR
jgi:hypothetical protein